METTPFEEIMEYRTSDMYLGFEGDPSGVVEFIIWLASSYKLPDQIKLLDIGCGTGRTLPKFASLGWNVVGMEPDPDYFPYARKLASSFENVTVEKGGFNEIDVENEFDIVVAIDDPFLYVLRIDDRADSLKRVFRALKPGGIMFLDMANLLWILKNYRDPSEARATVDGREIRREIDHTFDFHNNIWIHKDTFRFHNSQNEEAKLSKIHRLAIIGLPEIMYFVKNQDFANTRTYNSYKSPTDENITGSRLMLSAQKPI